MMTGKSVEELAEERLLDKYGKTRSALGPGTVIQGKLTFDTTIRIDGKLSGDVYSSKAIIVGKTGVIDAEIDVAVLIVIGQVKGEVRATERVEIVGGGTVEGLVEAPSLVIEEGSRLNGQCKMRPSKKSQDNSKKSQDNAKKDRAGSDSQKGGAETKESAGSKSTTDEEKDAKSSTDGDKEKVEQNQESAAPA